jgi:uncharacterized protein (DUF433 family)
MRTIKRQPQGSPSIRKVAKTIYDFALPGRPVPGYDEVMEPTAIHTPNVATPSAHGATAEHPADRVRIVSTPGICGGRPRIDGHRIQVEDVAIWHERMGMSPDEIVSEYPSITLADVHGALAYYFENRERIDADIEAAKRFAEEMRANAGPSRLQEKLRQRKADAPDDPLPPG